MNIATGKGMGIKTQSGMGITTSKGLELSSQQNYFTFNEYARKRQYLFGDRGKGNNNNRKKPPARPAKTKPVKENPVVTVPTDIKVEMPKKKRTKKEVTLKTVPEPKKLCFKTAAIAALAIAELRSKTKALLTTRLPPLEKPPISRPDGIGNTLPSMQRMLHLFG